MEIRKVSVLGAGIMGSGIAQVISLAGFEVAVYDIEERFVEKGLSAIKANLDRAVSKGKLDEQASKLAMGRIAGTTDMAKASEGSGLVIEAVTEVMEIKKQTFKKLNELCSPSALFASNTSGFSITEMAAASGRPAAFLGMHFFNPVPVMQLVELIRGLLTSDETFGTCRAFVQKLGKTPIEVREAPGFAVNRILCPMINEGIFAFSEGIASAEDIDRAMVLGANHPIGPLALADMVGLDTLLHVMVGLYEEFADPKYRPAPLLRKMVRAGHLGRKSGRGFYEYGPK